MIMGRITTGVELTHMDDLVAHLVSFSLLTITSAAYRVGANQQRPFVGLPDGRSDVMSPLPELLA